MDFLQLCERARHESGYSGSGPTSVTGQQGQLLKIVRWVQQAWVDIQLKRPNWDFMWEEFSFSTAVGTRDYLAADKGISDLGLWDEDSFLIMDPAIGGTDQNRIISLDYGRWRAEYRAQMDARPNDRPQLFTVLPSKRIRFEPVPDKIYTIDGEYKRSAQNFAANEDVPTGLPDDFHMIIVWQALKYYGFFEDAPEVLDEAETNFDNLLFRLEQEQLPVFSEDYKALA